MLNFRTDWKRKASSALRPRMDVAATAPARVSAALQANLLTGFGQAVVVVVTLCNNRTEYTNVTLCTNRTEYTNVTLCTNRTRTQMRYFMYKQN